MPFRFVRLSLRDELPLLEGAAFAERVEEVRPQGVAADVFRVEVMEVFDGARKGDIEGHLGSAGVGCFTGAEEGEEGAAAVGVEEGGGEDEGAGRGGGHDGDDGVAGRGEGGCGEGKGTGTGGGGGHHAYCGVSEIKEEGKWG